MRLVGRRGCVGNISGPRWFALTLAVGISALAVGSGAATASGAVRYLPGASCASRPSRTLVRGDLRIFWRSPDPRRGYLTVYVCSTRYGRRIRLISARCAPHCAAVGASMLRQVNYARAGRAFAYFKPPGTIVVYDLRTGGIKRRALLQTGGNLGIFVVKGDGAIAWIQGVMPQLGVHETYNMYPYGVFKDDKSGVQELDNDAWSCPPDGQPCATPSIDPSFLLLVGNTVEWKNSGTLKSAPIY